MSESREPAFEQLTALLARNTATHRSSTSLTLRANSAGLNGFLTNAARSLIISA